MSDAEMRREFEAWVNADSTLKTDRDEWGYSDMTVALLWHAWKAATAEARLHSTKLGQAESECPYTEQSPYARGAWLDGWEAAERAHGIVAAAARVPLFTELRRAVESAATCSYKSQGRRSVNDVAWGRLMSAIAAVEASVQEGGAA